MEREQIPDQTKLTKRVKVNTVADGARDNPSHLRSPSPHQRKEKPMKPKTKFYDEEMIKNFYSLLKISEDQPKEEQVKCFSKIQFKMIKSLHPRIVSQLDKMGFEHMTPVQSKAYPQIRKGKNVVIRSQTGTGKTLAYLVPIVNALAQRAEKVKREDGTYVIVLVPTRELATQILDILSEVARGSLINMVPGSLTGGENIKKEKDKVRKGLSVVIGTPGRILYHLRNTQSFNISPLSHVVFEECDQILDMNFKQEVNEILSYLKNANKKFQKVLLSACLTDEVNELIESLKDSNTDQPIEGEDVKDFSLIGFNEESSKVLTAPSQLKHFYISLDELEKIEFLIKVVYAMRKAKTILFVSTADQANFIQELLTKFETPFEAESAKETKTPFLTFPILKIHGYMQHADRKKVFNEFSEIPEGLLITTDVGSRGLDFEGVKLVVLFDPSSTYKDYINKVGRTARLNASGAALSLLYPAEEKYAEKLKANCQIEVIEKAEINPFAPKFRYDLQIRKTVTAHDLNHLARRAFVSFCRAYSLLKDTECFYLKQLNLHKISKSYGLEGAKAQSQTEDPNYQQVKDSKQISRQEISHLEMKRQSAVKGMKRIASKQFANMEFM